MTEEERLALLAAARSELAAANAELAKLERRIESLGPWDAARGRNVPSALLGMPVPTAADGPDALAHERALLQRFDDSMDALRAAWTSASVRVANARAAIEKWSPRP